jgi:hypothetical protein
MLEEFVREGTEPGGEGEEMVVILRLGPWYTEEGLAGDKLKDKAAKTPDVKGFGDSSGKNQLRSPQTKWNNGFFWRVSKEICYLKEVSIMTEGYYRKKDEKKDGRKCSKRY